MRISDWSSDVCSSDLDERGEIFGHLFGAERQAFAADLIFAVLEKFGRGAIEREPDVGAELEARLVDRRGDDVERGACRGEARGEAALIANGCGETLRRQALFLRVENPSPQAPRPRTT